MNCNYPHKSILSISSFKVLHHDAPYIRNVNYTFIFRMIVFIGNILIKFTKKFWILMTSVTATNYITMITNFYINFMMAICRHCCVLRKHYEFPIFRNCKNTCSKTWKYCRKLYEIPCSFHTFIKFFFAVIGVLINALYNFEL